MSKQKEVTRSKSIPGREGALLEAPLVKQALNDKSFKLQKRAISKEWNYNNLIPPIISTTGFNPNYCASFLPVDSRLHSWLANPKKSPRLFNSENHLLIELMFLVHDYLHAWGYLAINEILPSLEFGSAPINSKNFEDYVFCHLLTETIATVGLDYWFLATIDINSYCDMGSDFKCLTTQYHESYLKEYRRRNPKLKVQSKLFLRSLNDFYCSGTFFGYNESDFLSSMLIEKWLNNEIVYSEMQRKYTRLWLHHLRSENFELREDQLDAPIVCTKNWQKNLVKEISHMVWEKVKGIEEYQFKSKEFISSSWRANQKNKMDLRFSNLNSFDDPEECFRLFEKKSNFETNFKYFFYQYLIRYDYLKFDPELIGLFPEIIEKKDYNLLKYLFKNQKKIRSLNEPRDLFLLG